MCVFFAEAIVGTLLDYITHPQARSRKKGVFYPELLLRGSTG